MAKISVIIPCYNVEKYIDRCLQSVVEALREVEAEAEIICVDDCSTDNTFSMLQSWEQKFTELMIIVASEKNGKQGAARNIGIQYSSGDWIAFIDSDDWVSRNYFKRLLEAAESVADCEISCCGSIRDWDDGEHAVNVAADNPGIIDIKTHDDRAKLLLERRLNYSAWGKLIRYDFIAKNNAVFPEGLIYEDIYWGSIVHLCVKRAIIIEDCLYHYFVNMNSTVTTKNESRHKDQLIIQKLCWEEWERRGFLADYFNELQYEYLYCGYLPFIKILALRFTEPPIELFNELKRIAAGPLEGYESNPYFSRERLPELHLILLKLLREDISREQFRQLLENVKTIGL